MSRSTHPWSRNNDAPPYAVLSTPHSRTHSAYVLTLVTKTASPIRIIQEKTWQFCHFKVLPADIFGMLCRSHVIVNSAPFFQTQSNTFCLCWVIVRPLIPNRRTTSYQLSAPGYSIRSQLHSVSGDTCELSGLNLDRNCYVKAQMKPRVVMYVTVTRAEGFLWSCAVLSTAMSSSVTVPLSCRVSFLLCLIVTDRTGLRGGSRLSVR